MTGRFPRALVPSDPRLARLVVAVAAFLAYLPSLSGQFVYDDIRFVRDNPAVHHLSAHNVVRYFTDPTTMAPASYKGIYRPIRTLDFAIDWAVGGGRPWIFHLRNVLYHILVGLLLLSIFRRLLPGKETAALLATLVFVLHPVQTESVAWITSRGDVLVGVLFFLALLLHLKDRWLLAAGVLVAACFAKESAVVFPAAAVLVDRLGRRRFAWRRYAVYGALAALYFVLWRRIAGEPRHLATFWGGSYGLNLLTMSKGFLHYVREMLFPVQFTIDWHVPVSTGLSPGSAVAIVVLFAIAVVGIAAGPRSRFALAWFAVTILPVSNLLFPIGIPTAERFLYLPLAGVALWAGPILARSRGSLVLLGCLFLLTFARCFDWRTNDALFGSALAVADTPRSLAHFVDRELDTAYRLKDELKGTMPDQERGRVEEIRRHLRLAVEYADRMVKLYRDQLRLPLPPDSGIVLSQKSNALILLGRPVEALEAADVALHANGKLPEGFYNAATALAELGRKKEAAANFERAAELWLKRAEELREQGDIAGMHDAETEAARSHQAARQLSR